MTTSGERQEIMYCGAYRNRLVLGAIFAQQLLPGTCLYGLLRYFKSPKSVE